MGGQLYHSDDILTRMSTLHSYFAFILANPGKDLAAILILCNLAVAVTPAKYQKSKFFGILLMIANRVSILVHADSHGTLQIPVIAKALFFGEMPAAVPASAAVQPAQPTPAATAAPADPPKAS